MNNNNGKGRDIFFGVVALATLIVAIIGATLAYFSITASSNEGAVNATAKVVSIDYYDGQKVTAQANELIPADFVEVVQRVYEKVFVETEKSDPEKNLCTDTNGEQVCSVYRFSISSDAGIDITASLKNEHNGFEDLAYAIYVRGTDGTDGQWLTLGAANELYLKLNRCMNDKADVEACTKIPAGSTLKEYNTEAVHSLFGTTLQNTSLVKKSVRIEGTKTYDLVLFLEETGEVQNAQQGQSYNGTIEVDIVSTSGDRVSGTIDEETDERFQ